MESWNKTYPKKLGSSFCFLSLKFYIKFNHTTPCFVVIFFYMKMRKLEFYILENVILFLIFKKNA